MRSIAALIAVSCLACGGTSRRQEQPPPGGTVPPAGAATVDVATPAHGAVRSDPAGIDCGTTCQASFAPGAVTLHAVPDDGYVLQAWGGACTGAGDCALTLAAGQAVQVSATFVAAATPPPGPPPPSPPPQQTRYHVVDLGLLDPHWMWGIATGVAGGKVVGYGSTMSSTVGTTSFLWDGSMHAVSAPDADPGGTFANGVNASGDVVGSYRPAAPGAQLTAFLLRGSTFTDLGSLAGHGAVARAVNGSDVVVGFSFVDAGVHGHAFAWDPATGMRDLGSLPSCPDSVAVAVNDAGQAAGSACDPGSHAVLFENGQVVDLGSLGGPWASAAGINAAGQIVGSSALATPAGASHGFVWEAGHMTDAGTLPGGATSDLVAVNAAGVAVGTAKDAQGNDRAVVYRAGTLTDLETLLDDPGWRLREATGIDDEGRIAADALVNGHPRPVLLVPE